MAEPPRPEPPGRRFERRVVVVTGAGRGIGRETAERFAAEGASVAVLDLDLATAGETVAAIEERGGVAVAAAANVTVASEVAVAIHDVAARLGAVSILVNNAGGGSRMTIESNESVWDGQIDLNLKSVYLVSRAVWPMMVEQGGGVILNASSISGRWPTPAGLMAYGAAKAGTVMLTRYLAREGAPHNIRANCVLPGRIQTPAVEAFWAQDADPHAALEALRASVPLGPALGRLGSCADVAEAYLYLASDAAAWVTGTDLVIDGGATLGTV